MVVMMVPSLVDGNTVDDDVDGVGDDEVLDGAVVPTAPRFFC